MRRWILKAGVTDIDGLVLEDDVPMPMPRPGEVRVRVHAVSLNARDTMILNNVFGRTESRDMVPVSDGAGEIDALGAGVEQWAVGDRVTAMYLRGWVDGPPNANIGTGLGSFEQDGMLAEYIVLPAERVVRMPASLDYAEAATLPCAALSAWNALYGDHPIGPGSKVLTLGTGGVSLFVLLLACVVGAQAIATTSQDSKIEPLRALGASDVVNYRAIADWGQEVFKRTGGVDKVVDTVGIGGVNQSMAAVLPGGEVAVVGMMDAGDKPPDPWLLGMRSISIRGMAVGNVKMYDAMCAAIDNHQLKPPIARRLRFEDAKEAYQAQASPETFGKIVIDVA